MIWLLRHADAEDPDGRPDAERPLTEKGRAQARAAGEALAALGVPLDACLASPRVRARDTALLACEPLGLEVQIAPELDGGQLRPGPRRGRLRRARAARRRTTRTSRRPCSTAPARACG